MKKDLAGSKFGYLTVLAFAFSDKKKTYWHCVCVCGNIKKDVRRDQLKSSTISCGCKTSEIISKNSSKAYGEASFNEIYRRYKKDAKEKNREFKLDKIIFKQLTSDNCYYCGSSPSTEQENHKNRCYGTYVYNGIDRVDNNKGYILTNVVTCCETCNRMKLKLEQIEFIKHIYKISINLQRKTNDGQA